MYVTPTTYQLAPRKGREDRREIVVVKCYGLERPYRARIRTTDLTVVAARRLGDDDYRLFRSPERFWHWLEQYRAVLLVLVSADRELAMLGDPPGEGWALLAPPIHADPNRPRLYWAEWRKGSGTRRRRIDMMQLANLHPEGVYAAEVSLPDAVQWMTDWVALIRANDLGPKVEWTLARQSLLSYRRESASHKRRLRWHDDHELHRFEREVYSAQSPVRVQPADGRYEKVYHLDFVAHYVSILAQHPMPQEVLSWLPEGCEPYVLEAALSQGYMAMAEITDEFGERRLLTTDPLHHIEAMAVHRVAFYRPGTMLQHWARKMFRLRSEAAEHIRPAVKGMAVALWGRLSQRNHGFRHDEEHEYEPGEEALYGRGNILNHETGALERFTEAGEREVADPDAWRRERFPALGAHVLSLGRSTLEAVMAKVEPLYCHTDSVWSLSPPLGFDPDVFGWWDDRLQDRLGGIKIETVFDVEWRDGVRYVGGKIDASPGIARVGSRVYHRYDDPELLALPGTAAWEVRK